MQWVIGAVYRDLKRECECVLVAISPYLKKSGSYFDFRYMDSGKYIRQSGAKALRRFTATGQTLDLAMLDASSNASGFTGRASARAFTPSMPIPSEAFSLETPATYTPARTSRARQSKQTPIERVKYDNVIYVDFIKKCRIAI